MNSPTVWLTALCGSGYLPAALARRSSRQLFEPDFLPPSRPAARFCDLLPPLPLPLFLPPLLEALGEFAIEAARCLLIPFLRRPSYCLSSLTLDPWSLAIAISFDRVLVSGAVDDVLRTLLVGTVGAAE